MVSPNREPRIVLFSMRLYRWLLRLGPNEFLQEYEEIMLLDFRQHCRVAYKQRGTYSVLCLWPPMFIRAIVDMSTERISETYKKGQQERSRQNRERIRAIPIRYIGGKELQSFTNVLTGPFGKMIVALVIAILELFGVSALLLILWILGALVTNILVMIVTAGIVLIAVTLTWISFPRKSPTNCI